MHGIQDENVHYDIHQYGLFNYILLRFSHKFVSYINIYMHLKNDPRP